jgi:hypothetical protein
MADIWFLPFFLRAEFFVAPPSSPFDSPATSYTSVLSRRPIGFACPLRSGFAFIATPQRQRF